MDKNQPNPTQQPPVPQAFYDEFGKSADDRVMDYGRACWDAARQLTAAQGVTELDWRIGWAQAYSGANLYSAQTSGFLQGIGRAEPDQPRER